MPSDSLCGETVDVRAAGIGDPITFAHLSKASLSGIVYRTSCYFHIVRGTHHDNLRISAGYEKADEREFRHFLAFLCADEV